MKFLGHQIPTLSISPRKAPSSRLLTIDVNLSASKLVLKSRISTQ